RAVRRDARGRGGIDARVRGLVVALVGGARLVVREEDRALLLLERRRDAAHRLEGLRHAGARLGQLPLRVVVERRAGRLALAAEEQVVVVVEAVRARRARARARRGGGLGRREEHGAVRRERRLVEVVAEVAPEAVAEVGLRRGRQRRGGPRGL